MQQKIGLLVITFWAILTLIAAQNVALAQNPPGTFLSKGFPPYRISSQAQLDEVVAQLEPPATRLKALSELIDFSAIKLYNGSSFHIVSGDRNVDALQEQAVKAILKHTDFATVNQAIDSHNPDLQFWGVWFWGKGWFGSRNSKHSAWLTLIPKIETLAAVGDPTVRRQAVEELEWHSQAKQFLITRLNAETSPDIVMELLEYPYQNVTLSQKFLPYLLRFLNHQDMAVRLDALSFIGFNYNSAPMWQIKFDKSIVDKVVEMTKSGSEKEKQAALYALKGMKMKPMQDR